jgi:hypothetical protein
LEEDYRRVLQKLHKGFWFEPTVSVWTVGQ